MTQSPTSERRALAMLGDEQIVVRIDDGGALKRVQRDVVLSLGTDLYCADKNPGPTSKASPYQPGYMKLVAAMGGQLGCPPVVTDPVTGERRPNPIVETYPDSAIIRRVTATAVCIVRNPGTGEAVVSVQTIVYDAEHVLRQALLKLADRDDVVRIMSADELAALKAKGEMGRWASWTLGAGMVIAADMTKAPARDAMSTFLQQSATARQRTCSKAERLACDHNPLTRRTWELGQLIKGAVTDGYESAPFARVRCVAWVEHREEGSMARLLEQLEAHGRTDVAGQMLVGEIVDVSDDDTPDDAEDEQPVALGHTAPVVVDVTPPPRAEVVRPVVAEAPAARTAQLDAMLSKVLDAEAEATPEQIAQARQEYGIGHPDTVTDVGVLRSYRGRIAELVGGAK